jgi:hypothetical protein
MENDMKLRKFIATTIREYLNEQSNYDMSDYDKLKNIFPNIGLLIGYGKNSFVFEYSTDKVIKIKNNNNEKYNDYGFYKTYKIDDFKFSDDVLTINGKHLIIYNNTLYYIIMDKLNIPKKLISDLDDLEFDIKQYIGDTKKPPLLWLYNNIDNDKELIDLLQNIRNKNQLILSELLPLLIKMKKMNIVWNDIHKDNLGYNKNGKLIPFDLEF